MSDKLVSTGAQDVREHVVVASRRRVRASREALREHAASLLAPVEQALVHLCLARVGDSEDEDAFGVRLRVPEEDASYDPSASVFHDTPVLFELALWALHPVADLGLVHPAVDGGIQGGEPGKVVERRARS